MGLGGGEPSPTATINVHLGRNAEGSDHYHLCAVSQKVLLKGKTTTTTTKSGSVDAAGWSQQQNPLNSG